MEENKKELIVEGIVTEALPNIMFRVKISGRDEDMLCYLSGKMRLNRIRVLVGDKVTIEVEPYGGKGRIVKRG